MHQSSSVSIRAIFFKNCTKKLRWPLVDKTHTKAKAQTLRKCAPQLKNATNKTHTNIKTEIQ